MKFSLTSFFNSYFFANISISGPPGNGIPCVLANLSNIFPIPISNVSPITLYLFLELAIT